MYNLVAIIIIIFFFLLYFIWMNVHQVIYFYRRSVPYEFRWWSRSVEYLWDVHNNFRVWVIPVQCCFHSVIDDGVCCISLITVFVLIGFEQSNWTGMNERERERERDMLNQSNRSPQLFHLHIPKKKNEKKRRRTVPFLLYYRLRLCFWLSIWLSNFYCSFFVNGTSFQCQ